MQQSSKASVEGAAADGRTLEQQRAEYAWEKCGNYGKEDANFAKGLPALIMNSGLMQVLAFCHDKGDAAERVASDLRCWLKNRFPKVLPNAEFKAFMEALLKADPEDYQAITAEAFALLRWLRQMAAARVG
jgi:CRISPR-associated protein Cmr5